MGSHLQFSTEDMLAMGIRLAFTENASLAWLLSTACLTSFADTPSTCAHTLYTLPWLKSHSHQQLLLKSAQFLAARYLTHPSERWCYLQSSGVSMTSPPSSMHSDGYDMKECT